MDRTRLRQVALVASTLDAAAPLAAALGVRTAPFHDPGVGEFGLDNAVYAVGDTFLEVVAPNREGTTAGRYLARRGGDGGYMAIFQVPDTESARARAGEIGVRTVWQIDLPDISGTHFHPKDVPGAIVSVDTPRPPDTWRWAGPEWTGAVPAYGPGGIVAITVDCDEPHVAAKTWGALLAVEATGDHLVLDGGQQRVTFRPLGRRGPGIREVELRGSGEAVDAVGVTFRFAR